MLSSTLMTRGRTSSSASVYLFKAISSAFAAYNLHEDVDVSSFCHVYPDVVSQTNSTRLWHIFYKVYGDMEWSDTCRVNRSGKPHSSLSTCIYNSDMSNFLYNIDCCVL